VHRNQVIRRGCRGHWAAVDAPGWFPSQFLQFCTLKLRLFSVFNVCGDFSPMCRVHRSANCCCFYVYISLKCSDTTMWVETVDLMDHYFHLCIVLHRYGRVKNAWKRTTEVMKLMKHCAFVKQYLYWDTVFLVLVISEWLFIEIWHCE